MPKLFVYTKKGSEFYYSGHPDNYPGDPSRAKNCDVNDSLHIAISHDDINGGEFVPMRNDTGILFAKAEFPDEKAGGITKTLLDPWVFRTENGEFGIIAVRRDRNAPDPESRGCAVLYFSCDMIRFDDGKFIKLSDSDIRRPRCVFRKDRYVIEWETECDESGNGKLKTGETKCFCRIENVREISRSDFCSDLDVNIEDSIPGNVIEITDGEAEKIEGYLGIIKNIGVDDAEMKVRRGEKIDPDELPRAIYRYSDGSTHEKEVEWDAEAVSKIDTSASGTYEINGNVKQEHYAFPFLKAHMSDPCICEYNGKYFLTSSGGRSVVLRVSDTIEGLASAEPYEIYRIPEEDKVHFNMWAQEMHIINGVPYILTTVGHREWSTVKSHILRCNGDPEDPSSWEAPRMVMRANGEELQPNGISLDMTYFSVNGVHYVMWSDRVITVHSDRLEIDTADIKIAITDPERPWQLVSEPVTVMRPVYGWDRYETEVDEGPYLLRHGDDLFVTVSGSSTSLADLYCLGLMHAKVGDNLLDPASWDILPYPILTKESVPGEFGPGHNSFIKDPKTGDDLLIYHAVPHAPDGKTLGRRMGIRRVHWAKNGYPYLEMTEERDVLPEYRSVKLKITVE